MKMHGQYFRTAAVGSSAGLDAYQIKPITMCIFGDVETHIMNKDSEGIHGHYPSISHSLASGSGQGRRRRDYIPRHMSIEHVRN